MKNSFDEKILDEAEDWLSSNQNVADNILFTAYGEVVKNVKNMKITIFIFIILK